MGFFTDVTFNFSSIFAFTKSSNESQKLKKLKEKYYSQSTFLDRMARVYGELNFLIKILFFTGGISIAVLGIANIAFFVGGLSFLAIISLLSMQYDAMESRFKILTDGLDDLENNIQKEKNENKELLQQLKSSFEKNEKLTEELKDSQEEIEKIKLDMLEKQSKITDACNSIEDSASKVSESTEALLQKTNSIADAFSKPSKQVEAIFPSKDERDKTAERLNEIKLRNNEIFSFIKKTSGIDLLDEKYSIGNSKKFEHGFFKIAYLSEDDVSENTKSLGSDMV